MDGVTITHKELFCVTAERHGRIQVIGPFSEWAGAEAFADKSNSQDSEWKYTASFMLGR